MARLIMGSLCSVVLLAGLAACSRGGGEDEGASGFFPPTNVTRADYMTGIARRFKRLDRNNDGVIKLDEVPPNRAARIKTYDTNHDGEITLDEFTRGNLAWFDKADANHDGTLTSDERRAARATEKATAEGEHNS